MHGLLIHNKIRIPLKYLGTHPSPRAMLHLAGQRGEISKVVQNSKTLCSLHRRLVLMKNKKMVRVAQNITFCMKFFKNRAACHCTAYEYLALCSMQISMAVYCIMACCSISLTLNHHFLLYNTLPRCSVQYTVHHNNKL